MWLTVVCSPFGGLYLQRQWWQNDKQIFNKSFPRTAGTVRMSSVLASHSDCHFSSEILVIILLAYWPRSFFPDVLFLFSRAVPPSKSDQFTISRLWLSVDTNGTYYLAGNVLLLLWGLLVAFPYKIAFSRWLNHHHQSRGGLWIPVKSQIIS